LKQKPKFVQVFPKPGIGFHDHIGVNNTDAARFQCQHGKCHGHSMVAVGFKGLIGKDYGFGSPEFEGGKGIGGWRYQDVGPELIEFIVQCPETVGFLEPEASEPFKPATDSQECTGCYHCRGDIGIIVKSK